MPTEDMRMPLTSLKSVNNTYHQGMRRLHEILKYLLLALAMVTEAINDNAMHFISIEDKAKVSTTLLWK